ncbi:MAG: hypothetical protein JST42_17380, partial [Bacteroidetes bacterium]|nr:hypothetical protein [Bacteroidota bacterium]
AENVGDFLIRHDQNFEAKFGYCGVALFFPLKEDILKLANTPWCAYFGNQVASAWEDQWMSFLNKYLEIKKRPRRAAAIG